MLKVSFFKGLCISLFFLGSSALQAQEASQKPLWDLYFHIDGGTTLFLERTVAEKGRPTKCFPVQVKCLPLPLWPLVDVVLNLTVALGKGFCWQTNFYYSSTTVIFNAFTGLWPLAVIPSIRWSLGYLNRRDILFALGLGTKELSRVYGSLGMDMPFSHHFFFSLEASHPIYPYHHGDETLLRIAVKLGYKF